LNWDSSSRTLRKASAFLTGDAFDHAVRLQDKAARGPIADRVCDQAVGDRILVFFDCGLHQFECACASRQSRCLTDSSPVNKWPRISAMNRPKATSAAKLRGFW
jgi:hypothetical protein